MSLSHLGNMSKYIKIFYNNNESLCSEIKTGPLLNYILIM